MRAVAAFALTVILLSPLACGDDGPTGPGDGPEPASVDITPAVDTLSAIGATATFEVAVADSDGAAIDSAEVEWTSGDTAVAAVSSESVVEATGTGETSIVATAGAASDTAVVIVRQLAEAISIGADAPTINAIGDTLGLEAVVEDANGHAVPGVDVSWSSADTAVAVVDAGGSVVSRTTGSVIVHASFEAASGTLSDSAAVTSRQVPGIVGVTPAADSLGEGKSVALTASVADSNGVAIPGADIEWSSADPGAATVDSTGPSEAEVTAVREGAAAVTATAGPASGAAEITVLGKVAFYSNVCCPSTYDDIVYVMNTDGTDAVPITDTLSTVSGLDWSPDGSKVAYYTGSDTKLDIYTANADGSDTTQITDLSGKHFAPKWSPDGSRIAFYGSSTLTASQEIWVVNADGSGAEELTAASGHDKTPQWSPDGGRIAFESQRDGNWEIYVMDADGGNPTRLTNDAAMEQRPNWSPNGSQIAFTSARDGVNNIYVVDVDDTNVAPLTDDSTRNEGSPRWSPDGSRIAFRSRPDTTGASADLYVMDADGSSKTRLTEFANILALRWSPDGERLGVTADPDDDGWYGLYTVNADGSGWAELLDNSGHSDTGLAWRPKP